MSDQGIHAPAFPVTAISSPHGLSKLEFFAAMALQGLLAGGEDTAKRLRSDGYTLPETAVMMAHGLMGALALDQIRREQQDAQRRDGKNKKHVTYRGDRIDQVDGVHAAGDGQVDLRSEVTG